jgi:hypothetical protein
MEMLFHSVLKGHLQRSLAFKAILPICFLVAVTSNVGAQDFGGLLKGMVNEMQKEGDTPKAAVGKKVTRKEVGVATTTEGVGDDFIACLERVKALPASVSEQELKENSDWKSQCHSKTNRELSLFVEAQKPKKVEIDDYRRKNKSQATYEKCLAYLDGVEPVVENKAKLVTMDLSDSSQAKFPAYCEDSRFMSPEQASDVDAKRKAKLAEIRKIEATNGAKTLSEAKQRHKAAIANLGIPPAWLSSMIIFSGKKASTLEDWIARAMDNPNIKSFGSTRVKGNYGVTVKIPQKQTEGFVFKKDGDELYPSHYVSGDKAIPIQTEEDLLAFGMRLGQLKNGAQ